MKTLVIFEVNQKNMTQDLNDILKTRIFMIKEMNPNVSSVRLQYSE